MRTTILLILAISMFQVSCEQDFSNNWTYNPPDSQHDGMPVGTLDEVNIDAEILAKAVGKIHHGKYKEVHSILIYKDDMLVFEEYYQGHEYQWDAPYHHGDWVTWNGDMLHRLMSCTKSITSACIGIAIDHGFIESVHQSIFDYLPDHQHLNVDGKGEITIEHLVSMTSGLQWDEWGAPLSSARNDIVGIWFQDKDPVSFILERPLANDPGTSYTYSGGNMIILGEIIRTASGMRIDEFSRKYLFEPIGIDTSDWELEFENGVFESAGSLLLKPRDMAKIGATFLNSGIWNGDTIISDKWVEKSSVDYPGNHRINVPGEASGWEGYTYGWWTKTFRNKRNKIDMFAAGGWGGQHIMVLPDINTVVVFTGGNYVTRRPPYVIMKRFIIPAIDRAR